MFIASVRLATRLACLAASVLLPAAAFADAAQIERGRYLVQIGGCNDCHTPGYFLGAADMTRYLAGSEVAFEMPGLGAFAGRNLTPDQETGLGDWTAEQIVTALTTGERPDGRMLAPIMPWHAFAKLTAEDAMAIAQFLMSIEPVKNAVPGPFGVGETVPMLMFRILPPGATVADAPK